MTKYLRKLYEFANLYYNTKEDTNILQLINAMNTRSTLKLPGGNKYYTIVVNGEDLLGITFDNEIDNLGNININNLSLSAQPTDTINTLYELL